MLYVRLRVCMIGACVYVCMRVYIVVSCVLCDALRVVLACVCVCVQEGVWYALCMSNAMCVSFSS